MESSFTLLDWIVVAAMFAAILWISISSSRQISSQKDFLLGGGKLRSGMVGLSLFATLVSTLSYLSYTGEMVKYGPVFIAGILAFPVAGWIVGRFIIPRIMKFNVTSAYEILEMNVGPGTRKLATAFFVSLRFLWMCTIVFATVRVAVIPILGLPDSAVPLVCALMILFTILFTTIGGLKAVVATDALQSGIMLLGAIVTIVVICFRLGSLSELGNPDLYSNWIRFDLLPRRGERMTVANIFLMNLCWQVCTAGSDQMAIQRYLSVKDAASARRSYNISLLTSALMKFFLALVGLLVMVYFTENPRFLEDGETVFSAADTLFPTFIRIGLPAGLTGLIASALIAAAISSLSSGLNSVSSVVQEDILKNMNRFRGKEFSLKSIRLISLLLGLAVLGGSFFVSYVHGNLLDVTMKVVNLVVGPLFVLFFMAMFSPVRTDRGTVIGGLCSLAAAVGVSFFGMLGFVQTWNIFVALVFGIPAAMFASWVDLKVGAARK